MRVRRIGLWMAKDSLTSGHRINISAFASSWVGPLRRQSSFSRKCINLAWRPANDFSRRNLRTDTAADRSNVETAASYLLSADLTVATASLESLIECFESSSGPRQ